MKVFLSSTYDDLKDHRRHVIEAVRKAGLYIDPMEEWGADPREPTEFSQDRVIGCRLFILLIGRRRGHVPKGHTMSITQQEYQVAVNNRIDVLAYLLEDDALWHTQFDESRTDPEVNKWREMIRTKHGTGFFGHEPNSIDISSDLLRWISERSVNKSVEYIVKLTQKKEYKKDTHHRLLHQVINRLNQMFLTGSVEEDVLAILKPYIEKKESISEFEKEWIRLNKLAEIPYSTIRDLLKQNKIVFFLGTDATFLLARSPKDHEHLISELAKGVNYRNFEGSLSEISEFYEMKKMEYGRFSLLDNLSKLYAGVNKELTVPSFYDALASALKGEATRFDICRPRQSSRASLR